MPRSLAQPVDITCVACRQPFQANLWLIVDASERPDLATQIANDTLQIARCPHCGADQPPLDAPLLFHRADDQTLILAMPEGSSEAQTQQAAQQLGSQLIAAIPVNQRQPYLAQAHTVIGLEGLRHALSANDALSAALPALMNATTPDEVQQLLADHPVLVSDEAQQHLREYSQRLEATGHHDLAQAVHQRLAAIEAAQRGQPTSALHLIQALLDADGPDQRRALLKQYPISADVLPILAALADQAQARGLDAVARDLRVMRDEVADQIKHTS